jgi:hypothetical protein
MTGEDGIPSLPAQSNRGTLIAYRFEPLNLGQLRKVLTESNAGRRPDDAHLLLRDGRAALRRGGPRRAVIDAGSAVEITLATHNRTNVRVAPKAGPSLIRVG